jgi:hypothetical protein
VPLYVYYRADGNDEVWPHSPRARSPIA